MTPTKKTLLYFVFPQQLTVEEEQDLKQLLVDALAEFRSIRTPAAKYVENRYGKQGDIPAAFGEKAMEAKIKQVSRRIALAGRFAHEAMMKITTLEQQKDATELTLYSFTCGFCGSHFVSSVKDSACSQCVKR